MFITYTFQLVLSVWVLDGDPNKWIYSFNPSFPSSSQTQTIFCRKMDKFYKTLDTWFHLLFPSQSVKKLFLD